MLLFLILLFAFVYYCKDLLWYTNILKCNKELLDKTINELQLNSFSNINNISENEFNKKILLYKKIPIMISFDNEQLSCTTSIFFKNILDEFCQLLITKTIELPSNQKIINIYTLSNNQWNIVCKKPGRPLDSIFMDNKIKYSVLTDMKDFLSSKDWYVKHNVPYRRSYLLHGATGCGKSSLLLALCSELNLNIYWISLKNNNMDLSKVFNSVPKGQLILVDGINNLSNKSRLLSALDGPIAHTNHIVFFTTTSHKCLNPELIRPGRIDYVVELPEANKNTMIEMFNHFYSDSEENIKDLAEDFYITNADIIKENSVPLCVIQNHLIRYKYDPKVASINTIMLN